MSGRTLCDVLCCEDDSLDINCQRLIHDLNKENQDLTDKLKSAQQARSEASQAAVAAARQIDALKMALDIQQRKSGAYSDMLAMQGFFDHSIESVSSDAPVSAAPHLMPSMPRSLPVGDMQHVQRLPADGTNSDAFNSPLDPVTTSAFSPVSKQDDKAIKVLAGGIRGGEKSPAMLAYEQEIRKEENRVEETRHELGEGSV